jgi:hypothetical protein
MKHWTVTISLLGILELLERYICLSMNASADGNE